MTDEKYIKEATAHFEELLRSQLARYEKMAGDSGKTDFAALDKTVIGICDGDGIGPIIMKQAEKLLSVILSDEIAAGRASPHRRADDRKPPCARQICARGYACGNKKLPCSAERTDYHAEGRHDGERECHASP